MTDVTPLIKSNNMVVQSYGASGFKISGVVYDTHVIVMPDKVIAWDGESFEPLLAMKDEIDVVLLGTGKTVKILPKDKRPAGLRIDMMDTGAAARAYNTLLADGRRVAAALVKP